MTKTDHMFSQYDKVKLRKDRPEDGLRAGSQGYVVEAYSSPHQGYDVEFLDENGRTLALVTLAADDLEKVQ